MLILTFDSQGHYLGRSDYANEEGFEPGESATFERPVVLLQLSDAVASYEFIVETKAGE